MKPRRYWKMVRLVARVMEVRIVSVMLLDEKASKLQSRRRAAWTRTSWTGPRSP